MKNSTHKKTACLVLTAAMLLTLLPILSQNASALNKNHYKRAAIGSQTWTDDTRIVDFAIEKDFVPYCIDMFPRPDSPMGINVFTINSNNEIHFRAANESIWKDYSSSMLSEPHATITDNYIAMGVSYDCAFAINPVDGSLEYNMPGDGAGYFEPDYKYAKVPLPDNCSLLGVYCKIIDSQPLDVIVRRDNTTGQISQLPVSDDYYSEMGKFPDLPAGYSYAGLGFENNTLYMYAFGSDLVAPTISSLGTTSGPATGGTTVTINGSGFTSATAVKFGSANASLYTVDNDGQITAIAPPAPAGAVDVTVITPAGTSAVSSSSKYTYNALTQTVTLSKPEGTTLLFGSTSKLEASATSGLAVTFTSTDTGVASIIGNTLTLHKTGTFTIIASQAGNATYAPASSSKTFIVVAIRPVAPTNVRAEAGDGEATVYFTPPTSDGGATISYTVISSPGDIQARGTQSPIKVTGLTNGIEYGFSVTATNKAGSSSSQESNKVICRGTPSISPSSVTFDKYSSSANHKDIEITMDLKENTLNSISNHLYVLEENKDYTVSGTKCIIKKEYLKTLDKGEVELRFDYNTKILPALKISISDTTPSIPIVQPPTGVQINGQWQSVGSSQQSTNAAGQSVTTVTLDTGRVESLLASQGTGAVITIPVTGSDVASAVLNGGIIHSMQTRDAVVEIKTDNATYTLPGSAINIDSLSAAFGGSVSLSDVAVQLRVARPTAADTQLVTAAATGGGFAVLAPPVSFDVTCTHQGRTVELHSFTSYVQRTIQIPAGISLEAITAAVAVAPNASFMSVPLILTQSGGSNVAIIKSASNSLYALVSSNTAFSDMSSHWAKSYVNTLASRMAVSGYADKTYRPDNGMTRAEFTTMLAKALGLSASSENKFKDINATDWYCGYVNAAATYGLVSGYDNSRFRPNAYINREQAMQIMKNAMKLTGLNSSISEIDTSKILASFSDSTKVSPYAQNAAAICVKNGLINGETTTTIAPQGKISRAQAAAMIFRLLTKSGLI